MELLVKNKVASITGASRVFNEKDEQVYKVKGSWASNTFTLKYRKRIMTMDGKLLYSVCNKRIHGPLKRACIIYDSDKKEVARISENGAFKCGYQIDGATKKMEINGAFIGEGASITLDGKKIGKILSGNYKTKADGKVIVGVGILSDKFKLTVNDPEDAPFLVALVIAIDNMRDAYRRKNQSNANHILPY